MLIKKNIKVGKIKLFLFFFVLVFSILISSKLFGENNLEGSFTNIKVLDKISSKNSLLKLKKGENKKHKELVIKRIKCKNIELDNNPEITAYI